MSKPHRERLEKAGWKVGSAAEFLELSDVEAALVEAKLALGDAVRALRQRGRLSQQDLAKRMGPASRASPRSRTTIPRYPSISSSGRFLPPTRPRGATSAAWCRSGPPTHPRRRQASSQGMAEAVVNALQLVKVLYPKCNTEARHGGLLVRPGAPHIPPGIPRRMTMGNCAPRTPSREAASDAAPQ